MWQAVKLASSSICKAFRGPGTKILLGSSAPLQEFAMIQPDHWSSLDCRNLQPNLGELLGGWSSIQECGCYIPIRRIWWRNTPTITISSFDHGTHHDVHKKRTSSSALNLGGKSLPRPLIFSPGADGKLLARPAFSARWPEGERQNYTTHTEIAWVKNPSRDIHILHSICFSFSFSFSLSFSLSLSVSFSLCIALSKPFMGV